MSPFYVHCNSKIKHHLVNLSLFLQFTVRKVTDEMMKHVFSLAVNCRFSIHTLF